VIAEAAEKQRPILFFCKIGKDRTGIIAALVLAACGATEQEIVADYQRCRLCSNWHAAVWVISMPRHPFAAMHNGLVMNALGANLLPVWLGTMYRAECYGTGWQRL
jgi:protein-tyrosine phosphatase